MSRSPVRVLLVSKGHAYNHDAFLAMFADQDRVDVTLVEQPAAQVVLRPEHADAYDAVLFYDMSGIPGIGLLHDGANDTGVPPDDYVRSIEALLERGTGIVLLNHATVSWPEWPLWRQITGSSFMLREGDLDGERVPGSGYRGGHGPHPNPTLRLVPQAKDHPVLAGIEAGFEITDEIYLKTAGFEQRVQPLLRGDYEFVAANFTPPPLAPAEEQQRWNHPPGSDLLVWANAAGASPVVASDVGDSPAAFGNPAFRRLLLNALCWVASPEARAWARSRNGG
ncbi:MAG: ThuA domain-containing protein [Pseudomonadales bacterium]